MQKADQLAKAVDDLLSANDQATKCRLAMTGEDADLSKEAEMRQTMSLILVDSRFKQVREALAAYRRTESSTPGQLATA